MRNWICAVVLLALGCGLAFAGTDVDTIPVGEESVEELQAAEEGVMESMPDVTDPEAGLQEEIIDDETVDIDS